MTRKQTEQKTEFPVPSQEQISSIYEQKSKKQEQLDFESYEKEAFAGNVQAQFNVAECYEFGLGTMPNMKEAIFWYQLAVRREHAGAQYNFGMCYLKGRGVPQNTFAALDFLFRAAAAENGRKQGLAIAQYNLGVCYEKGIGVRLDDTEAVRWFILASKQGHAGAYNKLGFHYEHGKGVMVDLKEAERCYKLAADQGAIAHNLGECYENGKGIGVQENHNRQMVSWGRLTAAGQDNQEEKLTTLSLSENTSSSLSLLSSSSSSLWTSAVKLPKKDSDTQKTPGQQLYTDSSLLTPTKK